ncbi:MAG: 5'/3'-nucleotidase SurE [Desulfobacteraceae bacterium]|nr:5'/3'-nucleotidase SurE [Desulfobacteraceae bacterium]
MPMKIIVTNDDGIDAPGLAALAEIASSMGTAVVVAPLQPQSGVAHRVTARSKIRVDPVGENRYAVDGSPADCARIACKIIAPDADWLFSGINAGANLGMDVYSSGTVAAAREAAVLGYKALSVSQYIARDCSIDWETTGRHAGSVILRLLCHDLAPGHFWNLNLPHPLDRFVQPKVSFCPLEMQPHAFHYRKDGDGYRYVGVIHERPHSPGTDVNVCFSGKVAVTRLSVQTRHYRPPPHFG